MVVLKPEFITTPIEMGDYTGFASLPEQFLHGPDYVDGSPELFASLTLHFTILSKRCSTFLEQPL